MNELTEKTSYDVYVLEKDGKFFYEIKSALNKEVESGEYDILDVWAESNPDRIDRLRCEYSFLKDWNIVKVTVERTTKYTFTFGEIKYE